MAVLPTEGRVAMMFWSHACQPDVRRSNPASPVGMPRYAVLAVFDAPLRFGYGLFHKLLHRAQLLRPATFVFDTVCQQVQGIQYIFDVVGRALGLGSQAVDTYNQSTPQVAVFDKLGVQFDVYRTRHFR